MKTLKKEDKFKAKIKSIKKDILIETGEDFFDVKIEISEGEEIVEVRKLAFPLESSSEFIKGEVKKYIKTFNADKILAKKSKEKEELNSQADEVIEDLEGIMV